MSLRVSARNSSRVAGRWDRISRAVSDAGSVLYAQIDDDNVGLY